MVAGAAGGGGEAGLPPSSSSRAGGARAAPGALPPAMSGAPAGEQLMRSEACPPRRAAGRPRGAGCAPASFPSLAVALESKALKTFPSAAGIGVKQQKVSGETGIAG